VQTWFHAGAVGGKKTLGAAGSIGPAGHAPLTRIAAAGAGQPFRAHLPRGAPEPFVGAKPCGSAHHHDEGHCAGRSQPASSTARFIVVIGGRGGGAFTASSAAGWSIWPPAAQPKEHRHQLWPRGSDELAQWARSRQAWHDVAPGGDEAVIMPAGVGAKPSTQVCFSRPTRLHRRRNGSREASERLLRSRRITVPYAAGKSRRGFGPMNRTRIPVADACRDRQSSARRIGGEAKNSLREMQLVERDFPGRRTKV